MAFKFFYIAGCLADLENLENGPLLRKIRVNLEKSGKFFKKNDKPGKVWEIYIPEGMFTQIFQVLDNFRIFENSLLN